jgi:cation transporter-like permease
VAVVVETKQLLETVVASLVAGVGITVVFSVAIWGVARFADLSRSERPLAAGAAATMAGLAVLVTLAAVVFGIVVMSSK